MKSLRSQNYYEVLGVSRYAAPEEIRNAYELSKLTFTQNSLATYSLFSEEENEEILELISKAYETLLNPELRREYDTFLDSGAQGSHHAWESRKPLRMGGARQGEGPAQRARPSAESPAPSRTGQPPAPPAREPAAREAVAKEPVQREPVQREAGAKAPQEPPAKEKSVKEPRAAAAASAAPQGGGARSELDRYLSTLEHHTGESLRRVRELRGMSLFEMCSQTKIRQTYVEYIESENFSGLPAPVYVRGFIKLIATALALAPEEVANDYMSRYRNGKRA